MNGDEIVSVIHMSDELEGRNDRKLSVFDLSTQNPEVVELNVRTHAIGKVTILFF